MESRKLYRSRDNRMICGVCGGIGEYFNVDATLIRLVLAIFAFTGTGIFAYIMAAIIVPEAPGRY
ncbi:MAG: PspC domain-containing protein [Dorea sp.]|nr:PspC domain-containing protein [Dorea sp.]MCI9613613.1 PspC domain-containing protein [Dorea sp.]MDE7038236.1 PspC domain-containing protein [Lachnospiraceae bacterium]GFI49095.1 phage shock protein C [Lachnospiraceae bacterium]